MTKYELASLLTIHDLDDGKYHRLSAADQKGIFGFPVMGRKEFVVNSMNQGTIELRKRVIPNDTIFARYTFDQVAAAINEKRKLEVR